MEVLIDKKLQSSLEKLDLDSLLMLISLLSQRALFVKAEQTKPRQSSIVVTSPSETKSTIIHASPI